MSFTTSPAEEVTLSDLLSDGLFVDGDWVETKDQDPDGDVRLIQLADVGDGVFRNRSSRFLTSKKANDLRCTFLKPGDILIARMPEPLGRACIFPGVGQPAVTAVDVCIIRANPKRVHPEWLVSAINSPDFRSAMQQFIRGTTRQRISRRNLGMLELVVPDLAEQTEVTSAIANLESSRGSASNHISTARRAVERFRQAVLTAACSGRLTADWRDQNLVAAEDTPTRTTSPLIEGPESWSWATLGEIADIRGGIQIGAKRKAAEQLREVPYLRVANVQRGWLDLAEIKTVTAPESKIAALRLRPGDIFFNEGGDRDKLGRGWIWEGQIDECIHQNHVFRARLRDDAMQSRFFSWYGNTFGMLYFFDEGKQTVNLASLSKTKLSQLPVPVPTAEEQEEIVRRVAKLLAMADGLEARIGSAVKRVERTSQAVLAKAFRGELVA